MKLVILDRDGVINVDSDKYIKSPSEWQPIPGAIEAIARLHQGGYRIAVATNQSGIGRGLFDMAALNAMHAKMHQMLAKHGGRIDAVFFCPHTPEDGCDCRKPMPGLFRQIGERFAVDLADVPVVGDVLRDLQAGVAAGCEPHLVRTGKAAPERMNDEQLAELCAKLPGTRVHASLDAFAEWLIARDRAPKPAAGTSA